jgi:hypothetical protein
LKAHGDPIKVIACHCDNCQKRTGSVFQVSCWFPTDKVDEIAGDTRTFNGLEVDGIGPGISYRFCATCGSTVYWTIDARTGSRSARPHRSARRAPHGTATPETQMEPGRRFELLTCSLRVSCSTD